MKNAFLKIIFILSLSTQSQAAIEAKPLKALLDTVAVTALSYQETAMVFGFNSIKSCIYTSADLIVIKNYCSPKKNYPAKGYTLISRQFGIVDLYQEILPPPGDDGGEAAPSVKHDVVQSVFAEDLQAELPENLSDLRVGKINNILAVFYRDRPGACWTSNHSYYTKQPETGCNRKGSEATGLEAWVAETTALTATDADWNKVIETLESKFTE